MGAGWVQQLLCLVLTVCTAVPASASSLTQAHTFEILHVQSGKCLTAENDRLSVGICAKTNNSVWTWGSGHRLFSLGTQKCLGVDVAKPQDALKLVACDSPLMLWWRCEGRGVSGASGYGLSVKDGTVTVTMKSKDEWRQNGKSEAICDIPYHVVYTTGGNSNGRPCEFPFLYEGKWYHDCIYNAAENKEWCATSQNIDDSALIGDCLKPVSGCGGTWNQSSDLQQCYQFNTNAVLKWKEAYLSCQSQGADLLSISSPEELQYIIEMEDLPDSIWIGLNRLESSAGWQWSDNSPLNFINWDKGIPAFSLIDGSSCGKLNVNSGQFEIFPCDAALPYVCKKSGNDTKAEPVDYWHYSETECAANWTAYNGFCYVLQEPMTWQEAELSCKKENASSISLHSLADVELVVTKFQRETESIWSGFHNQLVPPFFKWSDGTEAQFTYWDQNEPLPPFNVTPNCVSFSGQTGRWQVRNCSKTLTSICRKPGVIKNATSSDSGCPQDKNWRKHGEYCYLFNTTEVSYEARCNLTITSRFEQEFLNSLMRKQSNIEGKYFWTSLRDVNGTGDYYWESENGMKDPTYSNWNTHQPALAGGCVAMATGSSLGKWEVKDCKTFKALSICKNRIGAAEKEEPPKPPPTTCPDGWKPGTDLYCYKLFHKERLLKQRTWEEAEGICEEFGGHLVSFSHMQDMNNLYSFLKSSLGTSNTRWVWLGLNKRNLGNWEWSDGHPISSTVLSEFQEDDYTLRDCAAFEINLPKRTYWMGIMDINYPETNFRLKPFHCDARLEWVCQIPKGTQPKTPDWYQPDWRQKMGPAVVIEGSEYWFMSNPKLGYKEAALYCASNGSELATIDTLSAMQSIQDHLKKMSPSSVQALLQNWWIKSSDFRGYHPFVLYRAMGSGARDCQSISGLSYFPDQFKPINCNEKLPFICRNQNISLLEIVPTKVTNTTGSCPPQMTLFGNKCFLKVPDKNVTFLEASSYCATFGGTLPTISNQHEQDFITYLSSNLQKKFWIGLRLALNAYKNTWVDDTDVTYVNFHPILQGRLKRFHYDPSNPEKNQQCVFFLNDPKSPFVGAWDFTACSDKQYVSLCQRNADTGGTAETVKPEDLEYEGRKYKLIQKNMTWYEALSECNNNSMKLVSITDQYQLSFISISVSQVGQPMWIGLSTQDDGIHYRWQDGSLVTLNRWSEESQEEDCTYVSLDGTWKTESCDVQLPGAICHAPAEKPADKTPDANHTECPHRLGDNVWIPFRNSCYTFLLTHKRWMSIGSRYICHTVHPDAYVLSIRDEEENAFVTSLLQPYVDLAKWVWLGLLYESSANGFRWHDETFVQYSNWREGRPNVTNDSFYAAMRLDGFWDIYPNPRDFQLLYLQQHSIVACKIEKDSKQDYISPMPTIIPYSNSSYFVLKKKLTWFEAVKECKEKDAHLASAHSDHQHLFLEHIVRQDGFEAWIGLWNSDGTSKEWSDGTEVDYIPYYFEKKLALGNCAYLNRKGEWNVKNCSEPLNGAICYKPTKQLKLTSEEELCPKTPGTGHWVRHKDFCYGFDVKIYNYNVYNNTEASKVCQTVDPTAMLLTINDEEENDFVSRALTSDPYVTSRIWLGVNSTSTGQKSVWLDGSPVQYTNWGPPKNQQMGPCVVLLPQTGTWSKVPCAPGQGRVVCKSPIRSSGVGAAIAFAVSVILVLLIGSLVYLYRKRNPFFSSVRYQRAEDQMESMIDYS
ncbi:lymphocyte antigen 75 isoform X2 [Dendropsophus ebraccatus]|uniref:lymphocyte antigen 75 isoform X2 n=1 Tax=Dendropsophus ebraccatus TaxID=150705 RepID=UPI0038310B64